MSNLITDNERASDPRLLEEARIIPKVSAAAFTAPLESMPVVAQPAALEPSAVANPRATQTGLGDFIPDVSTAALPIATPSKVVTADVASPAQLIEGARTEFGKQVNWLQARQGDYQLQQFFEGSGTDLAAAMEIQTPTPFSINTVGVGEPAVSPDVAARKLQLNNSGFNINTTQNVVDGTPGALGGGKTDGGWNVLEQLGGIAGFIGRGAQALGSRAADPTAYNPFSPTFWRGDIKKDTAALSSAFDIGGKRPLAPNEAAVIQALQPTAGRTNFSKATFGDYGTGLVGALNYGMDNLTGGNTIRGVIGDIRRNQTRAKSGLAPEWLGVGSALAGKNYSFVDPNSPNNVTGTNKKGGDFWRAFAGGMALDVITDINPLNSIRRAGVSGLRKAAVTAAGDAAVRTTRGNVVANVLKGAVSGLDNPVIDVVSATFKKSKKKNPPSEPFGDLLPKLEPKKPSVPDPLGEPLLGVQLPPLRGKIRQPEILPKPLPELRPKLVPLGNLQHNVPNSLPAPNVVVEKPLFNIAPRGKTASVTVPGNPLLGVVLPDLQPNKPLVPVALPDLQPKPVAGVPIPELAPKVEPLGEPLLGTQLGDLTPKTVGDLPVALPELRGTGTTARPPLEPMLTKAPGTDEVRNLNQVPSPSVQQPPSPSVQQAQQVDVPLAEQVSRTGDQNLAEPQSVVSEPQRTPVQSEVQQPPQPVSSSSVKPPDVIDSSLEDLFIEAERVGNKYQTADEIPSAYTAQNEVVERISKLVDEQFADVTPDVVMSIKKNTSSKMSYQSKYKPKVARLQENVAKLEAAVATNPTNPVLVNQLNVLKAKMSKVADDLDLKDMSVPDPPSTIQPAPPPVPRAPSPMVAQLTKIRDEVDTPSGISDASAALLRDPAAVPAVLTEAVRVRELVVSPDTGSIRRASDVVEEAQRSLIRLRLEQQRIKETPNFDVRADLKRAYTDVQTQVNSAREIIAGRAMSGRDEMDIPTTNVVSAKLVDAAVPIIGRDTFTPTTNPSLLYAQLKNLKPGDGVYTSTAEFVERTNSDLTELARFLGHYTGNRKQALNSDQLDKLRIMYGSVYGNIGYKIDTRGLKQYAKTGVARLETKPGNVATGAAQESQVVTRVVEAPATPAPVALVEDTRVQDMEAELNSLYDEANRLDPDVDVDQLIKIDERAADIEAELEQAYAREAIGTKDYATFEATLPDTKKPTTPAAKQQAAVVQQTEITVADEMGRVRSYTEEAVSIERMVKADMDTLNTMPRVEPAALDVGSYDNGLMNERVLDAKKPDVVVADPMDNVFAQMDAALAGMDENLRQAAKNIVAADATRVEIYEQQLRNLLEGVPGAEKAIREIVDIDIANVAAQIRSTAEALGGGTYYHGTKFDVPSINAAAASDVMPTRNPLGLGYYLHSNPERATDAAKARLQDNVPMTDTPIDEVGVVREVSPNVSNPLDANMDSTPELKKLFESSAVDAGFDSTVVASYKRRLSVTKKLKDGTKIKSKVADQWNKLAAAYAKVNPGVPMPEDMFRQFEFNVQAKLEGMGFDSIKHTTDEGNTLVVFNGAAIDELAKSPIGTGSQLEQAAAAFNQAVYHQGITSDVVSKVSALDAKVALGNELLKRTDELVADAADRADNAITRMLEADDALEATVKAARADASDRLIRDGNAAYAKEIDAIDISEYPGCL